MVPRVISSHYPTANKARLASVSVRDVAHNKVNMAIYITYELTVDEFIIDSNLGAVNQIQFPFSVQ